MSECPSLEIDDRAAVVEQLRGRIDALQGGPARLSVPVPPVLDGLLQLRTGGVYAVDSASLAMTLASGASAAGDWVGFVGWDDFGVEAAAQLGVALGRTVLVPAPGEHWMEVVAALVDVLRVVVLRPVGRIDPKSASVIQARLRSRDAVLLVHAPGPGVWPRVEASFSADEVSWDGLGQGSGRLHGQRARVVVRDVGRPHSREILLPYVAG
ncbi:hypothetical protein [Nocardioides sambongensis]|uniref:hypothetical protein n=1 Tax=Nocardioides sambongensis TaxID=2589074 RepID=UPI0011263E85|nr:hypothetical protein [Nocardioides sambongensis]